MQIVSFPDTVFFYALIDMGIDTDGDNLFSVTEAEEIAYLDVSSYEKQKARIFFRARAGIEPVIGHINTTPG